jgi:hypothetical protein
MFAWRNPLKARFYHQERGKMIAEVTPYAIIKEPNRYEMEAILQSLCRSVANLIEIQEEQAQRVLEIHKMIRGSNDRAEGSSVNGEGQATHQGLGSGSEQVDAGVEAGERQ